MRFPTTVILGCANMDTFLPIRTLSIFLPVRIGTSYDNNESRNYGLYATTFPEKLVVLNYLAMFMVSVWSRMIQYGLLWSTLVL